MNAPEKQDRETDEEPKREHFREGPAARAPNEEEPRPKRIQNELNAVNGKGTNAAG